MLNLNEESAENAELGHNNEGFIADVATTAERETQTETSEDGNNCQTKDKTNDVKIPTENTSKKGVQGIFSSISRLRIKPPWKSTVDIDNKTSNNTRLPPDETHYSEGVDETTSEPKKACDNFVENIKHTFENENKKGTNFGGKSHTNEGFLVTSEDEVTSTQPFSQEHGNIGIPEDKQIEHKPSLLVERVYEEKPILWTQIFGAISSATVHLAVGCVVGFTGVTLPALINPASQDLTLDKFQASIFSSIVNIGAIGGSILSGLMMTWLGQRATLLVYLPVGIIFWTIMAFARSFWLLVFCRVVQGLVIGICAGCANNYVVETVHKSVRGRLFATIDLALQVGFLFMYVVGSSQLSWRNVSLVCGIISMALPFIGMIFLPHSPRWLAMQGRKAEARKSLVFYRGVNFDVDSELNDIYFQLEKMSKGASVWDQMKMMTQKSLAIRILVLGILLFASHFTGNFAFIAYSVSIFKSAEVSMSPYLNTILVGCVRIVGVFIYITIADKFGRKPLFMITLSLSGLCMFVFGLYFFIKTLTDNISSISWVPLASTMLYVIFTMLSHPVLMLLRSELLPTTVRSVGVAVLYLFFFLGSFGVAISYPYMVDLLGSHWTFWIYGVTSFMMVLLTAVSIPETQGKSLEDIEELFEKKKTHNVNP